MGFVSWQGVSVACFPPNNLDKNTAYFFFSSVDKNTDTFFGLQRVILTVLRTHSVVTLRTGARALSHHVPRVSLQNPILEWLRQGMFVPAAFSQEMKEYKDLEQAHWRQHEENDNHSAH